ncbi:MAG: hypothetical protein AB1721_03325 [Patescibacteria group bacterium]
MALFSKKIGGFKLAIEKKKGYGYEIAAVSLGLALLALVVYGLIFISGLLKGLFVDEVFVSEPDVKFDLVRAKQISKIKFYLENLDALNQAEAEKPAETEGATGTEELILPSPSLGQ